MYKIVPSPLGGLWLQDDDGLVLASGPNAHELRLTLSRAIEQRAISPFLMIADEFGKHVRLKEYVKRYDNLI